AGGNAWQIFPAIACRVVFDLTGGVPREINTVASQALLNAFVDDARYVEPRHVQSVASEMGFESVVGAQEKTVAAGDTVVPDDADALPPPAAAPPADQAPSIAPTSPPEVQAREATKPVDAAAPGPDDDWEPPVAQVDEPSPSYPDLGVDDIYAEVETV